MWIKGCLDLNPFCSNCILFEISNISRKQSHEWRKATELIWMMSELLRSSLNWRDNSYIDLIFSFDHFVLKFFVIVWSHTKIKLCIYFVSILSMKFIKHLIKRHLISAHFSPLQEFCRLDHCLFEVLTTQSRWQ